ncbi:hypothetical protein [Periweissella beninensis]|uniref:Uncharacterized protein n=1 Tax=Periweissella beninensis TaxID=504936 RepID=A0ABT0VIG0_9LACO|nr:hypothetical protein [Periweissella beninensis]MBM7543710.1 hypothetical protein [Periweissella beninensis]MCM2436689.1 hypothetical protein [Periweissella beninensis]MCT4395655.1 hypothetical protein [Periweissella beninensis]
MRIQFYPGTELEAKLNAEATKQGVNVSILVVDALNKYYGLVGPNTKTEAQLETEVLNEVAAYVAAPFNTGTEFDLNAASTTYSQIDMTYVGKPSIVKARIGRRFAKEIGEGKFANVEQVFIENGRPKKSLGNRASLYRILSSKAD